MHRILSISEILRELCYNTEKCCLPLLARTCRTFQHIALDILWADLKDIRPLALCLPDDFASEEGGILTCRRHLSETDWDIIKKYAPRVRSIRWRGDVDLAILKTFSFLAVGGKPLFPGLKKLFWSDSRSNAFPFICLFIGPSLVDLHLDVSDGVDADELTFLSTLGCTCPQLKALCVDGDFSMAGETALSLSVCKLRHLKALICEKLQPSAWLHISQLPMLEDLKISLSGSLLSQLRQAMDARVHGPMFPNLRVLRLKAKTLELVLEFLEYAQISPAELDVYWLDHVTTDQTATFFSALSKQCHHDSFRVIAIDGESLNRGPAPAINIQTIRLLFCFSALRSINLANFDTSLLDDRSIEDMANTWPQLETFCLSNRRVSTNITFRGISSLQNRCPLLQHLAIAFNSVDLACVDREQLEQTVPNHKLHRLDVGRSRIENPAQVALVLFQLFDEIEAISCAWYGIASEERLLWGQVEDHLKISRTVRDLTRRRDRGVGNYTIGMSK
ncbi:hypothetical protein BV22DRAFT_1033808 [Leucogyrophana mollusca]|uniref:Uncharacterized protein n=1 Tax=Leucogyrophana mollusca TaxID=85980 RepID=A0ACB8BM58_9AGAM|nr:hypothetical protein BV22DRAFT_1033808 [Leucogyrophana mollusca]